MNPTGIIVGAATFLIIGIFHPLVIKMEYHLGKNSWWMFLAAGIVLAAISLFTGSQIASTIVGATAFSCFWSILEMFQQEGRVLRGWFPENPKRHDYYEALRRKNASDSGRK